MPLASDTHRFPSSPQHDAADLILLFNSTFGLVENTILVRNTSFPFDGGPDDNADEPVYLPEDAECPRNRIVFAHGFFASALHEIAHWCVAGPGRRQFVDYGYWYQPDSRDAAGQKLFERVELKPQAIEWAFSIAAGSEFDVSVDNLSGIEIDRAAFRKKVHAELQRFAANGFPPRAQQFIDVLGRHYRQEFRIPPDA
ncbi:MAG TPA: elongation factor P hydroxylase [Gammaproteobacteria bacterium]